MLKGVGDLGNYALKELMSQLNLKFTINKIGMLAQLPMNCRLILIASIALM